MEREADLHLCLLTFAGLVGVYATINCISYLFAPTPMKKVSAGYIKMSNSDYWLHYLQASAIFHSVSTIVMVLLFCEVEPKIINKPTTYYEYMCICNSFAYIATTVLFCFFNKINDSVNTIGNCLLGFLLMDFLCEEKYGAAMVQIIFYWEICNIFKTHLFTAKRENIKPRRYAKTLYILGLIYFFSTVAIFDVLLSTDAKSFFSKEYTQDACSNLNKTTICSKTIQFKSQWTMFLIHSLIVYSGYQIINIYRTNFD